MKKMNKKGFTIVELVIVIAVIAILAAVLIPTYSSLVKKANESADVQAVREMNTALAIYTAENGKPESSGQVKNGLYSNGINTATMTPVSQGYAFYWNSIDNKIVLVGGDVSPKEGWVLLTTNGYGTQKEVSNLSDLTTAISSSTTTNPAFIKLTDNITLTDIITIDAGKSVVIDLNNRTLTTNDKKIEIKNGGSVTVKNGTVEANARAFENISSNLTLEGVKIDNTSTGKGAVIKVGGISDTSIVDCEINTSYGFAIGTNSSADESDGARISIIGSTINATRETACAINITIGATVLIEDCTITGEMQGAFLRGCNATIKNSKFSHDSTATNAKWSDGNEGPVADIVFASGGTTVKNYDGYYANANYVCENVTAETVIVHEPAGGSVTVTGIDEITHTCHGKSGTTCTGNDTCTCPAE